MIERSQKYEVEIAELDLDTAYNKKYKFYTSSAYFESRIVHEDDCGLIRFVSLDKDKKVRGVLSASVNRYAWNVVQLGIVNYKEPSIDFVRDVMDFIDFLFLECNFNKVSFSVTIGNNTERSYDKFIKRYGGKIIGILEKEVKLYDGKLYDVKWYEIFKKSYAVKRAEEKLKKNENDLREVGKDIFNNRTNVFQAPKEYLDINPKDHPDESLRNNTPHNFTSERPSNCNRCKNKEIEEGCCLCKHTKWFNPVNLTCPNYKEEEEKLKKNERTIREAGKDIFKVPKEYLDIKESLSCKKCKHQDKAPKCYRYKELDKGHLTCANFEKDK